jgi:hypothetical protein
MKSKVIITLKPFMAFTSSLQPWIAHNMLIFMSDPHFKNLQLIQDYVGLEVAVTIVVKYDHTILMSFLGRCKVKWLLKIP